MVCGFETRRTVGTTSRRPTCDLGAAYGFNLARNHAFVDGNMGVALLTMIVFLGLNRIRIEAGQPEVVALMVGLADGSLEETVLALWLQVSARVPAISACKVLSSAHRPVVDLPAPGLGQHRKRLRRQRFGVVDFQSFCVVDAHVHVLAHLCGCAGRVCVLL